MEIKSIKNLSGSRAQSVTNIVQNFEKKLDSKVTEFVENTPIECNYYSIDKTVSTTGPGFNDNAGYYSGAVKYNLIKNFVIYGYDDELHAEKENNEVLDTMGKPEAISALLLPNTVQACEEDRLTLSIQNHQIIYRVTSVNVGTFHNKPYTKIEYQVDTDLPDGIRDGQSIENAKLIKDKFIFQHENVGTDLSVFLKLDTYDKLNTLKQARADLMEMYNDFFYDEMSNTYTVDAGGNLDEDTGYSYPHREYFPILVDLQMEFLPLSVYDVDTMLFHETISTGKNTVNWKTSDVRKFIRRKSDNILKEGIATYRYTYVSDIYNNKYNIISYFNNKKYQYDIYDYKPIYQGQEPIYISAPGELETILDLFYQDKLTIDEILETFENIDIDMDSSYLLFIPIFLCIVDIFLYNLLYVNKINRFY